MFALPIILISNNKVSFFFFFNVKTFVFLFIFNYNFFKATKIALIICIWYDYEAIMVWNTKRDKTNVFFFFF